MGLADLFARLFPGRGHGVAEVARRLGVDARRLRAFEPTYRRFEIKKRGGGRRRILAPEPQTKGLQRQVLRRLLARLEAHPAAVGFERGRSIVDNARPHVGRAVVLRLDLVDFFLATRARRVRNWFRRLGYNRPASRLLARLTTHQGGLPPGAPTSPRLSTLVNRRLDVRLARLAEHYGAVYTRYADDLTFSFAADDPQAIHALKALATKIAADEGYRVHRRRKVHLRRRHQRQVVTGLVVNERLQLPRERRRWLRAVEHRAKLRAAGRPAPEPTLSAEQLAGWQALRSMVERNAES